MKPYYEDALVTLYHGDCREIVPRLGRVDLVLTDPPYGVGVAYDGFNDTRDSVAALIAETMPLLIGAATRVVLTPGNTQVHLYPPPTWILAWISKGGANQNPWGFSCWQPILVWGPDPYRSANMGARPDVIEDNVPPSPNGHPCPKPESFWKKLLMRTSVDPGDVVLDPFAGSGTTLRAAKDMGRRAIGVEQSEKYCEIAARRMAQEVLPLGGVA